MPLVTPAPTVPPGFPDTDHPLTVRTASGHVHKLQPGWSVQYDATGIAPHLAGITVAGYFVSIVQPHIESLEQSAVHFIPAAGDTIGGRPVADTPL